MNTIELAAVAWRKAEDAYEATRRPDDGTDPVEASGDALAVRRSALDDLRKAIDETRPVGEIS